MKGHDLLAQWFEAKFRSPRMGSSGLVEVQDPCSLVEEALEGVQHLGPFPRVRLYDPDDE